MDKRNQKLVQAAVAGLLGAAVLAAPGFAKTKKAPKKDVKCYGVNKCAGHGQCGGPGHQCAGKNSCKGQGWLLMPKDSCEALEGGSLTPVAPKMQEKAQ